MSRVLIVGIALLAGFVTQTAHAHTPGGPWRWLGLGWGAGYHAPPCHTWGQCGHGGACYSGPVAAPRPSCRPTPAPLGAGYSAWVVPSAPQPPLH